MAFDRATALRYAPRMLFDEAEPFFPLRVGVTVLDRSAPSPSFRRDIEVPEAGLAIEYAVYWDWDIQHLYDLEHLWVYVDSGGYVIDAEGSFHGRYLKALLPDRSNLEGDMVTVYSQPGKHAFSPLPIVFQLLPNFAAATTSAAGEDGALVTRVLEGRVERKAWWDEAATSFLKRAAFEPSLSYRPFVPSPDIFVPWPELDAELPGRFMARIAALGEARSCR
jgi:hypothetical protein